MWTLSITAPLDAMEVLDEIFSSHCVATSWFETFPFSHVWVFEGLFDQEPHGADIEETLKNRQVVYSKVYIQALPARDWLYENRKTFQPLHVGPFFIHDSYYEGGVPDQALPLVVDASTAFGTGHHETTRFCLELIVSLQEKNQSFQHVLDLGCGTGILGIASYYLWHHLVTFSDNDPEALSRTQQNLERNRCLGETVLSEGFEADFFKGTTYDLILANILAEPLIQLAHPVHNHLAPGGCVILSGLLAEQYDAVVGAYEKQGFKVLNHKTCKVWSAVLLTK